MPNLSAHAAVVKDAAFRERVQAAIVQAAINISGEVAGTTIPFKSQLRQNFAGLVLAGQVDMTSVIWAVSANSTILSEYAQGGVAAVPDGDIEFVVATVWDDLSGAARQPDPA